MSHFPRTFALTLGFCLSLSGVTACRDDTSKPVGDVLAQDSSLDLTIMSATGDTSAKRTGDTVALLNTNPAPDPVMKPAAVSVEPTQSRTYQPPRVSARISRPNA